MPNPGAANTCRPGRCSFTGGFASDREFLAAVPEKLPELLARPADPFVWSGRIEEHGIAKLRDQAAPHPPPKPRKTRCRAKNRENVAAGVNLRGEFSPEETIKDYGRPLTTPQTCCCPLPVRVAAMHRSRRLLAATEFAMNQPQLPQVPVYQKLAIQPIEHWALRAQRLLWFWAEPTGPGTGPNGKRISDPI